MDNTYDPDNTHDPDSNAYDPDRADGSSLTGAERRALAGIARDLGARSGLGRSLRTFSPPPTGRRRAAAAAVVLAPLTVAPVLVCMATAGPTLATALTALPGAALLTGLTLWTARGARDR